MQDTFELLSESPTLLVGLCAFFGLLVGSFLNVVIYRLPEMMMRSWRHEAREILELPEEPDNEIFNLVTPRSRSSGLESIIQAHAKEDLPLAFASRAFLCTALSSTAFNAYSKRPLSVDFPAST